MSKLNLLLLTTLILSTSSVVLARDGKDWPVREQEDIEKKFPLAGEPFRVVVDNVEGYVHVTGVSGSEVRLRAHKTIRAETASDLAEGKQEVKLATTEKPGSVSIYYDAPWRCNGNQHSCNGEYRRFYSVIYDVDLEVPREARLVLSTVNQGDIRVEKTAGNFEVRGVNGGVVMTDISGSGEAGTVNGPVSVAFAANPTGNCSFKTINGAVDVFFRSRVSADLLLKTFNGQMYADFDVTPQSVPVAVESERHNGKFVYRSNGFSRAHAGNGGPELKIETLNGDIRLHQNSR